MDEKIWESEREMAKDVAENPGLSAALAGDFEPETDDE